MSKTPSKSASKKKPVDDEAVEASPKKKGKKGDKGKGKGKKNKASEMLSSDEDEGEDEESSDDSSDDGDSSGDDDEGEAPEVMGKMVVERDVDEVASNLPVNIHPLNAQSMIQQLFSRDRELMTLIYGTMSPSGVLKADPCMFFLQTLPVPPNRFYPLQIRNPQPAIGNPQSVTHTHPYIFHPTKLQILSQKYPKP